MSESLPVNGAIPPPPTTSPRTQPPNMHGQADYTLDTALKIRIGDGVAFISGKTVFGGT